MVLRLEVERARRADLEVLTACCVLGLADGGVGVGEVGDAAELLLEPRFELLERSSRLADLALEPLSLVDELRALRRVLLLAGACATSFCRRRISSTCWSRALRRASSATIASTSATISAETLRLRQFFLTASGLVEDVFQVEHDGDLAISIGVGRTSPDGRDRRSRDRPVGETRVSPRCDGPSLVMIRSGMSGTSSSVGLRRPERSDRVERDRAGVLSAGSARCRHARPIDRQGGTRRLLDEIRDLDRARSPKDQSNRPSAASIMASCVAEFGGTW